MLALADPKFGAAIAPEDDGGAEGDDAALDGYSSPGTGSPGTGRQGNSSPGKSSPGSPGRKGSPGKAGQEQEKGKRRKGKRGLKGLRTAQEEAQARKEEEEAGIPLLGPIPLAGHFDQSLQPPASPFPRFASLAQSTPRRRPSCFAPWRSVAKSPLLQISLAFFLPAVSHDTKTARAQAAEAAIKPKKTQLLVSVSARLSLFPRRPLHGSIDSILFDSITLHSSFFCDSTLHCLCSLVGGFVASPATDGRGHLCCRPGKPLFLLCRCFLPHSPPWSGPQMIRATLEMVTEGTFGQSLKSRLPVMDEASALNRTAQFSNLSGNTYSRAAASTPSHVLSGHLPT